MDGEQLLDEVIPSLISRETENLSKEQGITAVDIKNISVERTPQKPTYIVKVSGKKLLVKIGLTNKNNGKDHPVFPRDGIIKEFKVLDFLRGVEWAPQPIGLRKLSIDDWEVSMVFMEYIEGTPLNILINIGRVDSQVIKKTPTVLRELHSIPFSYEDDIIRGSSQTLSKEIVSIAERAGSLLDSGNPLVKSVYILLEGIMRNKNILDFLESHPHVLCHGDPNPTNWILGSDGRLVVVDWPGFCVNSPIIDLVVFIFTHSFFDDNLRKTIVTEYFKGYHFSDLSRFMSFLYRVYLFFTAFKLAKYIDNILFYEHECKIVEKHTRLCVTNYLGVLDVEDSILTPEEIQCLKVFLESFLWKE